MFAAKWAKLDWQDPFLLEQQLTDEERMVRDTAHQYAQEKLQPRIREAYQQESNDFSIFREMGELGLLGPTIKGYNCYAKTISRWPIINPVIESCFLIFLISIV